MCLHVLHTGQWLQCGDQFWGCGGKLGGHHGAHSAVHQASSREGHQLQGTLSPWTKLGQLDRLPTAALILSEIVTSSCLHSGVILCVIETSSSIHLSWFLVNIVSIMPICHLLIIPIQISVPETLTKSLVIDYLQQCMIQYNKHLFCAVYKYIYRILPCMYMSCMYTITGQSSDFFLPSYAQLAVSFPCSEVNSRVRGVGAGSRRSVFWKCMGGHPRCRVGVGGMIDPSQLKLKLLSKSFLLLGKSALNWPLCTIISTQPCRLGMRV